MVTADSERLPRSFPGGARSLAIDGSMLPNDLERAQLESQFASMIADMIAESRGLMLIDSKRPPTLDERRRALVNLKDALQSAETPQFVPAGRPSGPLSPDNVSSRSSVGTDVVAESRQGHRPQTKVDDAQRPLTPVAPHGFHNLNSQTGYELGSETCTRIGLEVCGKEGFTLEEAMQYLERLEGNSGDQMKFDDKNDPYDW